MQLNKLGAVTGLLLTAVLSACGGGGDEAPPAPAAPAPVALAVSNITLSSTTPTAIAETALQFDGGVCSGGSGTLTTSWDFGDATAPSPLNTHTYAEAKSGANTVTVTCTDTAGATKAKTLSLTIDSAAMNGFLGKTWTTYSAIDTSNVSPYPVAGLADSGDVYGVWLRRVSGNMEVAAGTTNVSSNSWTVSGSLPTGADRSLFDNTQSGGHTAAIDIAVSPNGHVMAAWLAGTSIWYATKNGLNGAWSTPEKIIDGPALDESIKVVVNNKGDGAIAYCASATDARVITYSNTPSPTIQTSVNISKKCGIVDTDPVFSYTLQRHRSFDIAIDNDPNNPSKIFAVGIQDDSAHATKSAVVIKSYTLASGWVSEPNAIADDLNAPPDSLSYSLSPNGSYAAIAWNQVSTVTPFKSNVFTSIYANGAWGASVAVQTDYPTKDYSRPLIAMNDNGFAFLAMRLSGTPNRTEVSNYDATATAPLWSKPFQVNTDASKTINIAIDNWGTGLITRADDYYSQAGTFTKKTGVTQWSGFKNISPRYPFNMGSMFHYQTMRALPNGTAILVTSVYDDITAFNTTSNPVSSGYTLLK